MENKTHHKREAPFEKQVFLKAMRDRGLAALTEMTKKEQLRVVNWAQDVLNQYRILIDQHPEKIKSSSDLPFSKEEIRLAIKVLLPAYLEKGSEDLLNEMKDKYVSLGAFQKIDRSESVLIDLIISEQKVLLEDIATYINELKKVRP